MTLPSQVLRPLALAVPAPPAHSLVTACLPHCPCSFPSPLPSILTHGGPRLSARPSIFVMALGVLGSSASFPLNPPVTSAPSFLLPFSFSSHLAHQETCQQHRRPPSPPSCWVQWLLVPCTQLCLAARWGLARDSIPTLPSLRSHLD